MNTQEEKEAEIVKFPGISSISLSITPLQEVENLELLEAIVRVYDENDEQIMQQKARSLQTIAKNLKLFIQTRTNLPINDRRMATWFSEYLSNLGVKVEEEEAYQIIKKASQALEKVSRVKIELVEPTDLVSIETDVLAKLISLKSDHLMSEDELFDLLEKHQTPISNIVLRTISYVNSGDVEHKDQIKLIVEPTKDVFEYNLIASFKNDSQNELKKVVISDIIPFSYKVLEVDKKNAGKQQKELLENGLKISWKVGHVAPGKEVKTVYSLERRIPRTIYIRKGEEIRIVQDYNSINSEEQEDGSISKYFISEVINLLPLTLDEIIVRDLLPHDINLRDSHKFDDELEFIDFGQEYGINVQYLNSNVETGTKFYNKYDIQAAPLVWKIDINVPLDDGKSASVTKILEPTMTKTSYVCSIVAAAPTNYKLINPIETGLKVDEFMPSNRSGSVSDDKIEWEAEGNFSVSMLLNGSLNRQPIAPKIIINGKEHTVDFGEFGATRKSKILSIPFEHVALFRKASREQ